VANPDSGAGEGIVKGEDGHPDEILTASYLDGTLPPRARDEVEAHLASCDFCRGGIALLVSARGLEAEPVPPEMIARATGPAPATLPRIGGSKTRAEARPPRRFRLGVGIAAGLLLAVALVIVARLASSQAPPIPVERGAASALRAVSPAPGETIAGGDLAFRWTATAGADRYVVTLFEPGGGVAATFESRDAEKPVPFPPDRPRLAAGRYLWSVRAMSLDRALAETRPASFELR